MSVRPPSPGGNLFAPSYIVRPTFFQRLKITASLGFPLLCLLVCISSSASAQTTQKSTDVKRAGERARRVTDDRQQPAIEETDAPDEAGQPLVAPQQPSQVRKTVLTYPSRPGAPAAERPALTNDLVIISRADETGAARRIGSTASNIPSIWPVVGALRSGVGMRNNPFGGSSVEYHKGQDISAPTGTPVSATADGVVIIARWVKGYGNGIYIDHGNGITTRYGHLSRIDVVEGQPVKRGQHLGLVGSTGRSTGPHLHYEVRINGQPTSPLPYLPALPPAQPVVQPKGQD